MRIVSTMQMTRVYLGGLFLVLAVASYWAFTRSKPDTPTPRPSITTMKLTSKAFQDGGYIPSKYTCDEQSMTPPFSISDVPQDVKSLVLLMDDPDVPKALMPSGVFDHWVLYNIPPADVEFGENQYQGEVGQNGAGKAAYAGPCPPTQYQPTTHRYFFKLYALDSTLTFVKPPTKTQVEAAMEGHIIATTTLMGLYDRLKTSKEND